MQYRRYQALDREPVIALWQRVFPDDPPHNEPAAMLDAKLKVDDLVFVAADDAGSIVGAAMAGYDGHRGWLYAVAVDAAQRRKGVGAALVRHMLDELQALGCIKINLQVRATNTVVIDFYKALGFSIEERVSMGLLKSR